MDGWVGDWLDYGWIDRQIFDCHFEHLVTDHGAYNNHQGDLWMEKGKGGGEGGS